MKKTVLFKAIFMSVILVPLSIANAATSVITNGGFEAGSTGWTVSGGNPVNPAFYNGNSVVPAATGTWAVDLGPSGTDTLNGGAIQQTVSITVPGDYTFSFDYTNELHSPSLTDFTWSLSGLIADSETLEDIGGGYVTFSRTYNIASTGNITVAFSDVIGVGGSIDAVIDNVSLTQVPVPGAIWLFASGFLGFMGMKKKQSKRL